MISRAERTALSDWAWTVDRWLLAGIGLLIVAGLVFAMAGSPPVAERLHLPTFHFVNRQVAYLLPALAVMLGASFLSPRHVRRVALVVFIVSLALVVGDAVLRAGGEGRAAAGFSAFSRRNSSSPPSSSLVAWAFSEGARAQGRAGQLARAAAVSR